MKSYYLFCRRRSSNYSIRSRSLTNSSLGAVSENARNSLAPPADHHPSSSKFLEQPLGAEHEPLMMTMTIGQSPVGQVVIPEEEEIGDMTGEAKKLPQRPLPLDFDHDRERWSNKIEFLLAVIGFSVDLGNVWRFPYICYRNGGGAFLIPYFTMFLLGGLPLFFLELALGQYQRSGCLSVWKKVCPVFKGIGFAICFIATYMSFFYNTIISWAVYFMFSSFRSVVPWKTCNNSWNTNSCTPIYTLDEMNEMNISIQDLDGNKTLGSSSSAAEFFMREVLEIHKSSGLDDLGSIKWTLALCLIGVYTVVYFALWKGPRSSGKAVWITATMPYIILLILLVHGLMLPGADIGIKYYLTPNWSKLTDTTVWIDAATQIFFSLGPGFGVLLALSSYNDFHNDCYKDAILTSFINCVTCLLSGFVIFSTLGYMSTILDKHISEVAGEGGPGLVFIVYPQAIATMKGSSFWAVIFFFMLITLGIDSTFAGLEALVTAFCDEFPHIVGRYRELFVLGLVTYCYFGTLPSTTYGGNYLVDFLDFYGVSFPVLFVVAVETIAVCWFYGVERFSNDVYRMLGFRPGIFWRSCWMVISPVFILVIFLFACVDQQSAATHHYPGWAIVVGWMIRMSSILCIPLYMLYHFFVNTSGSFKERIRQCITPYGAAQPMALSSDLGVSGDNNNLKFTPKELAILNVNSWKENENEKALDRQASTDENKNENLTVYNNNEQSTTFSATGNSLHTNNALARL